MPKELATRILWQLADAGVRSVTWTGGGEPTLHPQFAEVILEAVAVHLEQGLYTHGGHLPWSLAALLKRRLVWVYVSMDEVDRDAYKEHKGADRFAAACAGVKNLVSAEGNATIGLGFLLNARNMNQIGDMLALGRNLGVDYVHLRPAVQYDPADPGLLAEDTGWMAHAMELIAAHKRDSLLVADMERFEMYRKWMGHGYDTCHWSALQTVITPNGKVWRCANKREHPEALIGDLSVDSFEEIWGKQRRICEVDAGCRVMCRGHIANLVLDPIMADLPHGNFI